MIGRLALEAFTGLRSGSAAKIAKADINCKDNGILLPAAKLKTKKRQYVDGFDPPYPHHAPKVL